MLLRRECSTQKAFWERFLKPISRKIKTNRDVIYDEQIIYTPKPSPLSPSDHPLKHLMFNPSIQEVPTK
jgi:hypothetical protein